MVISPHNDGRQGGPTGALEMKRHSMPVNSVSKQRPTDARLIQPPASKRNHLREINEENVAAGYNSLMSSGLPFNARKRSLLSQDQTRKVDQKHKFAVLRPKQMNLVVARDTHGSKEKYFETSSGYNSQTRGSVDSQDDDDQKMSKTAKGMSFGSKFFAKQAMGAKGALNTAASGTRRNHQYFGSKGIDQLKKEMASFRESQNKQFTLNVR